MMSDLEAGELADQPGSTPPRLYRAVLFGSMDTTRKSYGAVAALESVTEITHIYCQNGHQETFVVGQF